jgi:hypothetical protein
MNAMAKLLAPLTIFLSSSYVNAFPSLNQVAGNQIWLSHLIRFNKANKQSCKPICKQTKQMDLDAELLNNFSPMKTWVAYSEPKQDAELSSKITDSTRSQTCGLCHNKSEPESFVDQSGINEEINHPIAAFDSSKNQWRIPTPINLDSSGLRWSTSMTSQKSECTLALGKPTKIIICPCSLLYYLF